MSIVVKEKYRIQLFLPLKTNYDLFCFAACKFVVYVHVRALGGHENSELLECNIETLGVMFRGSRTLNAIFPGGPVLKIAWVTKDFCITCVS